MGNTPARKTPVQPSQNISPENNDQESNNKRMIQESPRDTTDFSFTDKIFQNKLSELYSLCADLRQHIQNPTQLVLNLMTNLGHFFECEEVEFFYVDGDHLESVTGVRGTGVRRLSQDSGIPGMVANDGTTLNIRDTHGDSRLISTHGINNLLCSPIFDLSGNVCAVLYLKNKANTPFDEIDEQLLQLISLQLATMLDIMVLQEQLETRTRENQLYTTLSLLITNDSASSTLFTLTSSIERMLLADRCCFFTVNPHTNILRLIENNSSSQLILASEQVDPSIAEKVCRTGSLLNVDDAWNLDAFDRRFDHQASYRTQSVLAVPLLYDNRTIGICQAMNKTDEHGDVVQFTAEDEQLLEILLRVSTKTLLDANLFHLAEEPVELERATEAGRIQDLTPPHRRLPELYHSVGNIPHIGKVVSNSSRASMTNFTLQLQDIEEENDLVSDLFI